MCGLSGIVHFDPRQQVDAGRLRRMRDVLRHRGPDGRGLFIDGPVGLAHRRLAIVDLSAAGEQPMTNEDGSIWIVFNGEIYNHASIRPGLEAKGHHYRSRCDTETVVHLYEEEGIRVVNQLHGMFAFAIWDRRKRELVLGRDRLGIKPLYYACTGHELLFASEIKSIFAASSVRPKFNEEALPEFLSSRFVSGEDTFFQGVRKLLPGHVLTWSAEQGLRTERYWQLPAPSTRESGEPFDAQAKDLRARLEASVQSHLMSDVPLGVFLSGGLDSSALAAMTQNLRSAAAVGHGADPLQTFSVGFAEEEANELPYARTVARAIGADHRDVTVTPAEFFDALPHLVWHEDEPIAFPSSVPLYFVARLARHHVKVVLTGEGADELFLGYNRYRVTMWNDRLGRPYWAAMPERLRAQVRRMVHALPSRLGRVGARTFLALDPGIRSLFLENFAVHTEAFQRQLLARPDMLDERDLYAKQMRCYEGAEGGILDRMSRTDLQTYLHELLMKQDQMSMAASIESRVPFLDDELVEHVAALPSALKVRLWRTKAIFREAVRDTIPREILTRRKMGFPVPVGRWLRHDFWPIVQEFVLGPRAADRGLFDPRALVRMADEHRSGRASHGDRLWLLVNLEIWQRIFCEGEDASAVMQALGDRRQGGTKTFYAHPLGQDGRAVAFDDWRAGTQPADRIGTVPAS
ncbi:MAG: asparagine synthase (glutamine-hydrolyzing) [Acidobacteria bacterium]|nr:MAG: asparagine synthase (glutamine-hydrolyzing) [Acidobacteriota bacterium]